ncbi:hypothetical protein CEK69_02695 [Xanthomonas sp. LMG 12462]|nr:hypothetical protein CEK69_02695 [Xanthomonas sp. LMG 12462]
MHGSALLVACPAGHAFRRRRRATGSRRKSAPPSRGQAPPRNRACCRGFSPDRGRYGWRPDPGERIARHPAGTGDATADRRRCCDDAGCATLHPVPCAALQLTWPRQGRDVLSCFDTDAIDVYQLDRPAIARFALDHQRFGDEFSYDRMSWIKPNFLWRMSRAGWARKQ